MADAQLVLPPGFRVTDANDQPIAGAKLKFYSAGTSTPATVYSDSGLLTSLGATVTCDDGGYPTSDGSTKTLVYTGTADYKLVITDADDVILVTHDNIKGAPSIPAAADATFPKTPVLSRTTTTTITTDYESYRGRLINANPTGGAFVITLPSAVTVGDGYRLGIRHKGTANTATIKSVGGQVIGGANQASMTSFALVGLGHTVWLVSDGAGWTIDTEAPPLISHGLPFISITDRLTAPPASPTPGARYIINGTPTGDWATLSFAENAIAEADGNGSWVSYTPADGWMAYIADENLLTQYRDTAWVDNTNWIAPDASALGVLEVTYAGTGTNTIAASTWTKISHATTAKNSITGASLGSGQITLPTGNYIVIANLSAKVLASQGEVRVRSRFYSASNNATRIGGMNRKAKTAVDMELGLDSPITGFLSVTAASEIFEHQWWSDDADTVLSEADGSGVTTKFASVTIVKIDAPQGPQGEQGVQGPPGDGVSPETYGAEGDGLTDDTVALQAALDSGNRVLLRGGKSYLISESLILNNNSAGFIGDGTCTLIMSASGFNNTDATQGTRYGTNAVGILADGIDEPICKGFEIKYQTQTQDRYVKAIAFRNCTDICIEEVEAWNFTYALGVIYVGDCDRGSVSNNYIHTCHLDGAANGQVTGIEFDNDDDPSSEIKVHGNIIKNLTCSAAFVTSYGYQSDGINVVKTTTNALSIVGNLISGVGEGIDFFGTESVINGNVIKDCYIYGIKLVHGASKNTVNGNSIKRAGLGGIVLAGSSAVAADTQQNVITGNNIEDIDPNLNWNGSSYGIGIIANGGTTYLPRNNLISENCINCGSNGEYGILAASGGGTNNTIGLHHVINAQTSVYSVHSSVTLAHLYTESGALKYRGGSGTTTTIANA